MKLLLRRGQRQGLIRNTVYLLEFRAHLTETERAEVARHQLAGLRLYQRADLAERGSGILGLAARLVFRAANLTLTVEDLVGGRRIETDNIVEILALEDQVRNAAIQFGQLLAAATAFEGDEVVDL